MKKYSFHRGRNRNRNHPLRSRVSDYRFRFNFWLDSVHPYRVARQESKFREHDLRTGGS